MINWEKCSLIIYTPLDSGGEILPRHVLDQFTHAHAI